MNANPVVWFEIHVQDMARARRFYETVFQGKLEHLPAPDGSDSQEMPVSYTHLTLPTILLV